MSQLTDIKRSNRLLTMKQAYVLYLVVGNGLTHEEAGIVMGIDRTGVTHLLKRARIHGHYRHKFKYL